MNPLRHYEFTMTITAFNIIAAQDCGVGEIHLWSVWIEWQGSQPYSVSWWTTQKLDFLVLDLTDWHDRSIVWDGREENCRDMLQVLSGQEWCCWASLRPKSIGPRKAKNPHFAQEQHCTKRAGSVPEAFCRAQLGRNKVLEIVLCSLKQLFSKKRLQKQLWISVRPLNFKHKASVTISRSLEHDFLMLFFFSFFSLNGPPFMSLRPCRPAGCQGRAPPESRTWFGERWSAWGVRFAPCALPTRWANRVHYWNTVHIGSFEANSCLQTWLVWALLGE